MPGSPISRSGALTVVSAHLNGGFARAADLKARDVMTDLAGAEEMIEIEEGAVEHMNADHPDAVRLYATKLLGEADGAWQVTGVDPDGPRSRARRSHRAHGLCASAWPTALCCGRPWPNAGRVRARAMIRRGSAPKRIPAVAQFALSTTIGRAATSR